MQVSQHVFYRNKYVKVIWSNIQVSRKHSIQISQTWKLSDDLFWMSKSKSLRINKNIYVQCSSSGNSPFRMRPRINSS
jgi:hypothetical protein